MIPLQDDDSDERLRLRAIDMKIRRYRPLSEEDAEFVRATLDRVLRSIAAALQAFGQQMVSAASKIQEAAQGPLGKALEQLQEPDE